MGKRVIGSGFYPKPNPIMLLGSGVTRTQQNNNSGSSVPLLHAVASQLRWPAARKPRRRRIWPPATVSEREGEKEKEREKEKLEEEREEKEEEEKEEKERRRRGAAAALGLGAPGAGKAAGDALASGRGSCLRPLVKRV